MSQNSKIGNSDSNRYSPINIKILGLSLVLFASFIFYMLIAFIFVEGQNFIFLFGQRILIENESRLALLVILSGAMGSFVHTATSFSRYLGHDKFYKRWLWWYILRPFIGSALALIFYFVIRGGLFTSNSSDQINLYGILAISGLVGMFSKQATDKLDELFNNLFKTEREQDKTDSINTVE